MDAAVWTAIGLLAATSLGTLFYLGCRIDVLASRMDDRFAQVDARFEALIRMEVRFDRVDARFDAMESRFRRPRIEARRALGSTRTLTHGVD